MPIKPVLRIGNPILREAAKPVTAFDTPELHALIQDLLDTMAHENGAGLAAPQIGVGLRVVIFGVQQNPRYPDMEPFPETILINPKIIPLDDQFSRGWEGCLSVPGLRGMVERHHNIRYSGFDQYGQRIERTLTDFHSRVVQHECDHLEGVLYVDKLVSTQEFGFVEELIVAGKLPGNAVS